MNSLKLPNFLIVGAAKAGTTSLYYYLKQHPQVFLPEKKELNYFSVDFNNKEINYYEEYFNAVSNEVAIGEASPSYLYFDYAAKYIHECIPGCKIIMILRNPVERFISDFYYHQSKGLNINYDINEFVMNYKIGGGYVINDITSPYNLIFKGFYYKHIVNFIEYFNKTNIFIGLFDDLISVPEKFLKQLCIYLNIDDKFDFNVEKIYNKGLTVKSNFILKYLYNHKELLKKGIPFVKDKRNKWIKLINMFPVSDTTKISEEARLKLKEIYSSDIKKLSDFIERDLSHWN